MLATGVRGWLLPVQEGPGLELGVMGEMSADKFQRCQSRVVLEDRAGIVGKLCGRVLSRVIERSASGHGAAASRWGHY